MGVLLQREGQVVKCLASTVVEDPGVLQIAPMLFGAQGIVENATHPHAVPVQVNVDEKESVRLQLTKLVKLPPTPSVEGDAMASEVDGRNVILMKEHDWPTSASPDLFWLVRRDSSEDSCNCEVVYVSANQISAIGFGDVPLLKKCRPMIDTCTAMLPLITNTKAIGCREELVCFWKEPPKVTKPKQPKEESWRSQRTSLKNGRPHSADVVDLL